MKTRILLLPLLCLLSVTAISQQVEWNSGKDFVDITPDIQVLEDPGGKLSFEQVQSASFQNAFEPSNKPILNFGFTESAYWLHFRFNNTASEKLVLEIAHAFLPETDLYYKDSAGKTIEMRAGYTIPLNEKIIRHHFQVFPLLGGDNDFYVRLISNSHPIRARIYKESVYDVKTYRQRLVYGFFIGCMFFVILSNLFFYFSLRNKLYLFYAGIVLVYVSYASAVMDGFILYFIPHIDLMFWYITIPTIGVPLQMIYALVFLEVKKYAPKLQRFTIWLIAYFVLYAIIKFWLPLTTVLAMNTVHALISFFTMGYLGYSTGKRGNRLGHYFALAYFIYFVLVLMEATYIQVGKPAYFFELSHVSLATLIEAFILSFLLSKRFEFEKQDAEKQRHEAQAQLLEKTMENERIVKEQNITLEKRVEERTRDLNNTVENLKQTQVKLIQSEKLASLGELTAGIAHEIQNPLNFVNNFSEVSNEMLEEMRTELEKGNLQTATEIAEDIKQNLVKINHHGQRADAIVKGMLQHSRTGTGQKEPTDINKLADEYVRLAYHGMRAKDKDFNAEIKTEFDESIGKINVVQQDIGRVLLNLFNNAFYAGNEKLQSASGGHKLAAQNSLYVPIVTIVTKKAGDKVVITVEDNGNGIPQNIIDKIFQPFFTTKPTGQGTGLGLSLAYDIIKAHAGEIKVETKENEGSEFVIQLPYNP
ncbi:MAG TPA: 7TM-DISM domain-containing protein [Parafilimonas sp.]|nr:7TM-DISM domain-containing protein [Parafilimonas sp.]